MLTNGVAIALPAIESAISLHYDPSTGKQYSYNGRTGKTEWLEKEDESPFMM